MNSQNIDPRSHCVGDSKSSGAEGSAHVLMGEKVHDKQPEKAPSLRKLPRQPPRFPAQNSSRRPRSAPTQAGFPALCGMTFCECPHARSFGQSPLRTNTDGLLG